MPDERPMELSHPESRSTLCSALGDEQGERAFELRSLGEFDT
jgi:hypothetical protein